MKSQFEGVPSKIWDGLEISDNYFQGTPCWEWQLGKSNGYGCVHLGKKVVGVHRAVYEFLNGDISGLTIDHLCRNLICANPAHLEAVSNAENIRRGHSNWNSEYSCKYGHPYPENRYSPPGAPNVIQCRECKREWNRNHRNHS